MHKPNKSIESVDLVIMEYEKLQEYYLWSLNTHNKRLDLYVKLFIGAATICSTLLFSPFKERYLFVIGICFIFLAFGLFSLERIVSAQITNIWCVIRLNYVRDFISTNFNLKEIYRPIPIKILRKRFKLWGIFKYRFVVTKFVILGNSIPIITLFIIYLSLQLKFEILISLICGISFIVIQIIYFNIKHTVLSPYLENLVLDYENELIWLEKPGKLEVQDDKAKKSRKAKGNSKHSEK